MIDLPLPNDYRLKVLHLFRALLRECTYLPDPQSRTFMHNHIVGRFHANVLHPKARQGQRQSAIFDRRFDLIKTGQKGLKSLCRANHGHPDHLIKVLAMTYGRVGPRRHELLNQLPKQDPTNRPNPPISVETPQEIRQWRLHLMKQDAPIPSSQLTALLRSQGSRKEVHFARKPLKKLEPDIPKTNAWGRPFPIKRGRNEVRKWFADALNRVMPPLPEREWELLRDKAMGTVYLRGPVCRRGLSGEDNIGRETYRRDKKMKRPHTIDSRFMRRLWEQVFLQCPLLKEDPTKPLGWHVTWPDVKAQTSIGLRPAIIGYHRAFHGVDDEGKLLASG